jgi:hypothetical protein
LCSTLWGVLSLETQQFLPIFVHVASMRSLWDLKVKIT